MLRSKVHSNDNTGVINSKFLQSSVQDTLLKCLPADEHSESMVVAVLCLRLHLSFKVTELLETLKEKLDDSSLNTFNFRSSSPGGCDCDCHCGCGSCEACYDSEGCPGCFEYHDNDSCGYGGNWPFGGWSRYGSINDDVTSTVSKAKEYLANDQPGPAAVVLDALTVALLSADNQRLKNRWSSNQVTAAIESLRKAWIEVLLHPDLPKTVEDKVRERLKNAINGASSCFPESSRLKVILEMRKWTDELLVKCFAGKLTNQYFIEHKDVVEARLAYLEKNKRSSDALSYMLSCKIHESPKKTSFFQSGYGPTVTVTSSKTKYQRLINIIDYRRKFVLLLAKVGKIDQALNVLKLPTFAKVSKDAKANVNFPQSTLANMNYINFKELLSAMIVNDDDNSAETGKIPSPSKIPEEKLKNVLAVILTGTQVNSSLRCEPAMVWYIDTFCETQLTNKYTLEVKQEVKKEAELLVSKAKKQFLSPSEIKPPKDVSFKVFVVELFATLAANLINVNNSSYPSNMLNTILGMFKNKNLLWACISVVCSSEMSRKMNNQILDFVLVNLVKPLGSRCIPFDIYQSWVKNQTDLNSTEKYYEIALCILLSGKGIPGPEGSSLCKQAVLLVETLADTVDARLNGRGSYKDISVVLKKIKEDFGKEASKHGLQDFEGKLMSLCFMSSPSYDRFENAKKTCKSDKWPKLKSSMIDFLKKRRTSHTKCCIEVFGRCDMFNEVKLTLAATGYYNTSFPNLCEKIKVTMKQLKKDKACQFVEACADWLGHTMCEGAFYYWQTFYKSMHASIVQCVKLVESIKTQTFVNILLGAMHYASERYCCHNVQVKQRTNLERWLQDIKELFGKGNLTAWSWAFQDLTTGPLKRKPAVIRHLKCSKELQAGTLSHHELLATQVSAAAVSTPSAKHAQGHAQGNASKTPGCGTQASSAATTASKQPTPKTTSTTSTQRVAGHIQVALNTLLVNAVTHGRTLLEQPVNTAVSTSAHSSAQRVAGNPQVAVRMVKQSATPATKQSVSTAVNASTHTTSAQRVAGNAQVASVRMVKQSLTPATKQPVNMVVNASTHTTSAQRVSGTPQVASVRMVKQSLTPATKQSVSSAVNASTHTTSAQRVAGNPQVASFRMVKQSLTPATKQAVSSAVNASIHTTSARRLAVNAPLINTVTASARPLPTALSTPNPCTYVTIAPKPTNASAACTCSKVQPVPGSSSV
ncbi:hypothetical protein OS493_013316 [Desmophyllum pertusum]|uniref:Uncharacterized protein n=1 Tax=Desmophyllum pertusum TaxID=174260 RepID=A0A9W9YDF2_9CNID|nr:hypothetical protein OS493_013316 [Desmophyllum pertusum]